MTNSKPTSKISKPRRPRRLKLISEFVSSSNSKRSLNYHLNLT